MAVARVTFEEELRKNPEVRKDDVSHLREWLQKQPHLPTMSDAELVIFLNSCYYRIEPTKKTIDNYFTARTHAPDIFTDRNLTVKGVRDIMNVLYFTLLPGATPEKDLVFLLRFSDTDPSKYMFCEALKAFLGIMDAWTAKMGSSPGFLILFDMLGMQLSHLARVNLAQMAKFFFYLQEGMPVRLKGMHFCNVVSFIDQVMSLIKPFMKKELAEKIKLHKTLDSLHAEVDKDHLPHELGGSNKSFKDLKEETMSLLQTYGEWLKEDEKRTVQESLRPGKARTATDLFGVEGSFKKLDID